MANAMLKNKVPEGIAIATAIKRAKLDPSQHGLKRQ